MTHTFVDLDFNLSSVCRLTVMLLLFPFSQHDAQLQDDLNILQDWEHEWDMEFNPSKCHVIRVTRSRSPLPTSYTLHGQTLEVVSCARYLGVLFNLDFVLFPAFAVQFNSLTLPLFPSFDFRPPPPPFFAFLQRL